MRALDRKLWRGLGRMKVQLVAISLVIASGVALFIGMMTAYQSLQVTEAHYYAHQHFADVWINLARAPLSVLHDVRVLPGVAAAEGRIEAQAILDVPGMIEPASALLVSSPESPAHALNVLHVRRGRNLEAGRAGEALVSEAFAEKNGLAPGAKLSAVVAGRSVELTIVGVALSPEYVMQIPPGARSPEEGRFAVIWMARRELEGLVDFRDAFNEVTVKLAPRASEQDVIDGLDRLLDPYGGRGAYGRTSQPSHVMLEEHIEQLRPLAIVVPAIFLAVAAFLVNVVLGRIVATEREQVGMLKAFGYSKLRIALHYFELATLVAAFGVVLAVPIGAWLARVTAVFFVTFFRFPVLVFRIEPGVLAVAALVGLVPASAGALGTLTRVLSLPPVVAMLPEAPTYTQTWFDRVGFFRWLPPAPRMIARNVMRGPLRALLTMAGMSLAMAVVVLGSSINDAMHRSENVQFQAAQREDVGINLSHLRPFGSALEFARLPGVRRAEPYRIVSARVGLGKSKQNALLYGLPANGTLRRPFGGHYELASVVPNGVFVTEWLGQRYRLRRGDPLAIEIREDCRRTVVAHVAGFVPEPLGVALYMELGSLDRLLGEPETYSGVNLRLDSKHEREFYDVLKRTPEASAVALRRGSLANFRAMSETIVIFVRRIEVLFSVIIAFGVVYNGARIALAERTRELATLRVLGFTRAEISFLLLGEIAVLAAPAIPLGLAAGFGLSGLLIRSMSSSSMHIPLVVETSTYAFAVAIFGSAALSSALVVRRRLDRLDLISVLKARE
jgi:putative ABC transport system permease protein